MLKWLKRLFVEDEASPEPVPDEQDSAEQEPESVYLGRDLFHFHDCDEVRSVDPLETYNRLIRHEDFSWDLIQSLQEPDTIDSAVARVAAIGREAFRLKPWDEETGTGTPAAEAVLIVTIFIKEVDELKKKLDLLPTTSQTSETSPSPDEPSPRGHDLDLSSTPTESTFDEQADSLPPSSEATPNPSPANGSPR